MKYLKCSVYLFVIILTLISCGKAESSDTQREIFGTWKLSHVLSDIGNGEGKWEKVDDGYEYSFSSDNTFTSNRFKNCSTGNYTLEIDELSLDFDFESTSGENELFAKGILVEKITFDSDDLIINPTYIFCVEACGWKFKKID